MRSLPVFLALAAHAGVIGVAPAPARAATATQFLDETVIAGIDAPSNSEFLPDGRIFIPGRGDR